MTSFEKVAEAEMTRVIERFPPGSIVQWEQRRSHTRFTRRGSVAAYSWAGHCYDGKTCAPYITICVFALGGKFSRFRKGNHISPDRLRFVRMARAEELAS